YGTTTQGEESRDLFVDRAGNIYLLGDAVNAAGNSDFTLVKYSPDGTFQWARSYDGPGAGTDYAVKVALDPTGNVYVSGYSDDSGSRGKDFALIKYSGDGTPVWTNRVSGAGNFTDVLTGMGVDRTGQIYLTGQSYTSATTSDFLTVQVIQQ